jgi:hypothetical protein
MSDKMLLPIQLFTKHTITIMEMGNLHELYFQKKIFFYSDPLNYLQLGFIHSRKLLNIKEKRLVLSLIQTTEKLFIYKLYLPLTTSYFNNIDEKSINIRFGFIKKNITIILTFNTRSNIRYNLKLSTAFGNKGIVRFADLSMLTTRSGQSIEILTGPCTLFKRQAMGQIFEMEESEEVFHNGQLVAIGGFCTFFPISTFPHENLLPSGKMDKLTLNAAIGLGQPLLLAPEHRQYGKTDPHLDGLLEHFKIFGKVIKAKPIAEYMF